MKVIFLDFDGVINSATFPTGEEFPPIWFDSRLVTKINDIVRDQLAEVKFVISSDWRHGRSIAQLQGLLEDGGNFIGEIIGCTGDRNANFSMHDPHALEKARAWEISDWLQANPDVTHWIALDDLDLGLQWLVQTDHRTGISDVDVEVARKMLSDPIRGV